MTTPLAIPKGYGICPVCNGTTRVDAVGMYSYTCYGFDAATRTAPCRNCGGQYMSLQPLGYVRLRREPPHDPCVHEYTGYEAGRCYWKYTCKQCGDHHAIDSGD